MKHRIALALLFLTAAPAAWATDIEVTADTPARAVLQPDLLRRTGQTFPGLIRSILMAHGQLETN